ncbi:hypothetical protein [Sphingobium fuliginis]|uniref:Uncharacterized protein n=1 Tax=Sphingobium fuliginis ATCC 27551 TaxID=1208342 RepID=A0A5B8CEF0_SPHSA|nr:hypothetical protein [Sphingobium fuliginis]QDC37663.1 hypothetical protein FIL70_10940 [Sphingobium fuliginis ATCC 27551]
MNDRNAFLQGQGSPIRDDAAPPEQGWRGERAADEPAGKGPRRRRITGVKAEVEDISGTAFVEAGGADMASTHDDGDGDSEDRRMQPRQEGGRRSHPDGVSDLDMSATSPGGESAGAPYPHGRRKSKNDFGSRMGHGGQTEIGYHGTGHLGGRKVGEDDNRNGVAETDD